MSGGLADLGGLSVTLTMIEERWNRSVENAKKQLGDVDAKLGNVTKASMLMRTAFTVAGAAIAGALVKMALAAADLGEQMQNNMKLTGTSAREFSELAYAARTVGVDMGGMADAIKEASENTSKAASGAEKQSIAIRAIGASIEELQRMTPAQRFERIAQGISELKDDGDRARVALDLLGGSGVRLLPLLSEGAVGVRRLREEAQAMSQSFSEEQVAKLADASDAVDRLKESWHGFGVMLSANVAPVLADVLNLMTGDPFKKFGNKLGTLNEQLTHYQYILGNLNKSKDASPAYRQEVEGRITYLQGQLNRRAGGGPGPRAGDGGTGAIGMTKATADLDADKKRKEAAEKAAADAIKANADMNEQIRNDVAALQTDLLNSWADFVEDEAAVEEQRQAQREDASQRDRDRYDAEQQARADRLELLRQEVLTEEQIELEKFENTLTLLESYSEAELAALGGYHAAKEALEKEHVERLKEIRERAMTDYEKFHSMSWDRQLATTAGAIVNMTAGVAAGNKKLFEIHKAASLAQAIVSLPAAIIESYKNAGGYPYGIAAAAAMAAAGAAQIAQIKNSRFNGGGGGGSAASTAAPAAAPVRSAQTISISGLSRDQFFSGSQVRQLLERLQEALNDGGTLNFDN